MTRLEYLRKNLLIAAEEGSLDPSEVDEYVRLASPDEPAESLRPSDMAELTKLVARELRKRGVYGIVLFKDDPHIVYVSRPMRSKFTQHEARFPDLFWAAHSLYASQFDNLTPSEIADAIQAEEARRAQEWAGDE